MRIKLKKIKFTYESIIGLFICLYSFSSVALAAQTSTSWISDIITIILMALLGIYLISHRIRIELDTYTVCTFLFLLLSFFSALWAIDPARSLSKTKTMLLLFIVTIMVYLYIKHCGKGILIAEYAVIGIMFVPVYSFVQHGLSGFVSMVLSGMRVGGDINNVNVLGQYCAVAAIGCVYFLSKGGKFYLWGGLVLSVIMCLGTGSRQALLYLLIVFFAYYGIRLNQKNLIKTILIIFVAVAVLYHLVVTLPYFDFVRTRIENMFNFFLGSGGTDRTMISRSIMIERGIESFLEHPILGIGINNSTYLLSDRQNSYYLHNNFVEVLASLGIIGFFLYYYRVIYAGVGLFHGARVNPSIALVFSILISSTIMDYGSVTYYSKISWLLCAIEIAIVEVEKINKQKEMRGE